MKRSIGAIGALTLGLGLALAAPTAANAADQVILVPNDFNPALSDTRATGHYEVDGTGLRVWTDGAVGSRTRSPSTSTRTPRWPTPASRPST